MPGLCSHPACQILVCNCCPPCSHQEQYFLPGTAHVAGFEAARLLLSLQPTIANPLLPPLDLRCVAKRTKEDGRASGTAAATLRRRRKNSPTPPTSPADSPPSSGSLSPSPSVRRFPFFPHSTSAQPLSQSPLSSAKRKVRLKTRWFLWRSGRPWMEACGPMGI